MLYPQWHILVISRTILGAFPDEKLVVHPIVFQFFCDTHEHAEVCARRQRNGIR